MKIPIQKDILVSFCYWGGRNKEYRYLLYRAWDRFKKAPSMLVFIGLNPSTADEKFDDPTVRRCINFARRLGYGSMVMLNIFALRSTDPHKMQLHDDPVGPMNDKYIATETIMADTVLAWGCHGKWCNRGEEVVRLLEATSAKMMCFGKNADGSPKHPLYLRNDTQMVKFK